MNNMPKLKEKYILVLNEKDNMNREYKFYGSEDSDQDVYKLDKSNKFTNHWHLENCKNITIKYLDNDVEIILGGRKIRVDFDELDDIHTLYDLIVSHRKEDKNIFEIKGKIK